MMIDNGNHLLLSGNHAALAYVQTIGAARSPCRARRQRNFRSSISQRNERWRCGRMKAALRWWIFDAAPSRARHTAAAIICPLLPLLWAGSGKTIADVMNCDGDLYTPAVASGPAGRFEYRSERSLRPSRGRDHARDVAGGRTGLSSADRARRARRAPSSIRRFAICEAAGAPVNFGHRLRALVVRRPARRRTRFRRRQRSNSGRMTPSFLPFRRRSRLPCCPTCKRRTEFRAIVNAHFRVDPPAGCPAMIGVINGTVEWIFAFPDRLSVTISGADRLLETPRETLARDIWRDVVRAHRRCGCAARHGRSCANGEPLSPHCRSRTTSVPLQKRTGTISFSPATGRQPDCPRRSKARCDRETGRRTL